MWVGCELLLPSLQCMMLAAPTFFLPTTGQLVWRRHTELPAPSRQGIVATCTHLLPLVEMYCKWELQEDCGDLQALMRRFDSESELESHALGRSFLFLVRGVDGGLDNVPRRPEIVLPTNPFDAVRARLATINSAIRGLHNQVLLTECLCCICDLENNKTVAFNRTHSLSNGL